MRRMQPRGNVLLIAVISVVVLTVLVVGAIQFTGQNRSAANLKSRGDRLSACGEAARNYVFAQLQQIGSSPSSIRIDEKIVDDADATKQSQITTAHVGGAKILSVVPVSPAVDQRGARPGSRHRELGADLAGARRPVPARRRPLQGRERRRVRDRVRLPLRRLTRPP